MHRREKLRIDLFPWLNPQSCSSAHLQVPNMGCPLDGGLSGYMETLAMDHSGKHVWSMSLSRCMLKTSIVDFEKE